MLAQLSWFALARSIVTPVFPHLVGFSLFRRFMYPEERSRSLPASSSRFSTFSSDTADQRVLHKAARDSFV